MLLTRGLFVLPAHRRGLVMYAHLSVALLESERLFVVYDTFVS